MSRVAGQIVKIRRVFSRQERAPDAGRRYTAMGQVQNALGERNAAGFPRIRLGLAATRIGTGFARGLQRQTPCKGGWPFTASFSVHSIVRLRFIPRLARDCNFDASCALWAGQQNRVRGQAGLVQCFAGRYRNKVDQPGIWPLDSGYDYLPNFARHIEPNY